MTTKIILRDFNEYLYELPHNILKLSTYAQGKATSLEFNVISSDLNVSCGETIMLYIDEKLHFSGKIFDYSKDYDSISFIAYDNLIYLKSKDTILLKNESASTVIKYICSKIGVNVGEITETVYILPYVLYENTSYFDIINTILNDTSHVSGIKYVLSDKNGEISLSVQRNNNKIVNIDESVLLTITEEGCSASVYNVVHIYQITADGQVLSCYAYDDDSISRLGKIQKSVNVDRNLTQAQCNLIAQNTLVASSEAIFSIQIEMIAVVTIDIYDILVINNKKYKVVESVLTINSSKEIYTLVLENEVD